MSASSLKEKYLIFKVRHNKDAAAYGSLYDYYVERIYRFILFKVSTKEEAEDLTSEVFLKTWEYINTSQKKIDNLNALLYRVARNAVIDYYRAAKHRNRPTDEEAMERIHDSRSMVAEVDQVLDRENIELYLNQLKDVYREVVMLKYIEEFSVNEIAEIMKKSAGNVRVLLHRALQAMRELMEEK